MQPFLDSFKIIRARTRYGPIDVNSVLEYEKIPQNLENHFQILLPDRQSYVPFTKRFLDSIHLQENCLSPKMLENYCYSRFDMPGKIQAFINTKKECVICDLQHNIRKGKGYNHPHVSLPSHFLSMPQKINVSHLKRFLWISQVLLP